jgi:hypothetical protein
MSQHHNPVDSPLTAKSKDTTVLTSSPDKDIYDNDHDRNLLNDHDHDDYDDDDWIDMQTATAISHGQKATTSHGDHLVPVATTTPSPGEHSVSLSLDKDHLDPLASDTLAESAASLLSLPSDYGLGSSADITTADTASFPHSLQVPSVDQHQHLGLDEDAIPGSATPSNSESEYSLLNPSSDQSRKNSLTGFHAFTPTHSHSDAASSPAITDDQLSQGSQQEDDDQDDDDEDERDTYQPPFIGVTSPSFSDFVQVGSDQGDDFSMSPHPSSLSQTPSPTSFSEDKARMDDTNYSSHEDDDILSATSSAAAVVRAEEKAAKTEERKNDSDRSKGIQETMQRVTSGQGEDSPPPLPASSATKPAINSPAFSTLSPPISTTATSTTTLAPTQPCPPLLPTASPVDKGRYRTTVADARSSSEEEREHATGGPSTTGIRYRGAQTRQDDRSDIRTSFFGASTATSTMPGGLNLGLDADIDHLNRPAPQPAAVPLNDPPVDERQCRICLGGADEEDTLGRLISPCLCKGSMKYVHIEWYIFLLVFGRIHYGGTVVSGNVLLKSITRDLVLTLLSIS